MAEPFKNLINATLVQTAAAHLSRQGRGFDAVRFSALALPGLDALEMKARAMQICTALEATLPAAFDEAAALIEAALAPAGRSWAGQPSGADGLAGWILWPVGEYIARHGQATPERALQALHALTQRFTAEFAIRPFIVHHPALVFATLQRWTQDPSDHVRRLVSEGSRPRLPWGLQLKSLVADPVAHAAAAARAAGRPQRLRAPQRGQPPERHRQGPPGPGGALAAHAPARRTCRRAARCCATPAAR
jgi:hypothetical protein